MGVGLAVSFFSGLVCGTCAKTTTAIAALCALQALKQEMAGKTVDIKGSVEATSTTPAVTVNGA